MSDPVSSGVGRHFCVNEKCKRALEDAWAFCPMCGTDNRAPSFRPAIFQCSHVYIQGAEFCLKCGMPVKLFTPPVVAAPPPPDRRPAPARPSQDRLDLFAQLMSGFAQQGDSLARYSLLGWILLIGGGLCTGYFFLIFDTTVEVPSQVILGQQVGGGRVHNMGLMAESQNGIIVGIAAAVIGLTLVLFAKSQHKRP